MSGLGWIHFSDTTRRRVLKVIDLLSEKGTIDELGIGVVRNAFSNELFNGISTIMTRARYYYTVPYLMIDYLRTSPKVPISTFMKNSEADIMEMLTRKYTDLEKEKIIGYTIAQKNISVGKRVQDLVRKPSEIYWGGIRTFGMFTKTHSFAQICQAVNQGNYLNKSKDNIGNKNESGDDDAGYEKWLDLFNVPYISNWDKEQIELTAEESEHFKERIDETMPGSFLSTILKHPKYTEEFLNLKSFHEILDADFFSSLNPRNAKVISTAIQFWELMYGAHIRFNILLQNKTNQNTPISFDEVWKEWLTNTISTFNWGNFDKNFLWDIIDSHSRVNWNTKNFINHWIDAIKEKASTEVLDEIVSIQEKQNKKERSKLLPQHLENYDGWVGINRLEYRLPNVQTIVRDIANPLTTTTDA